MVRAAARRRAVLEQHRGLAQAIAERAQRRATAGVPASVRES
jgi:hypothetical protein